MFNTNVLLKHVFAVIALLIVVLICYSPGLSGGFLLDDFSTLPPLAQWVGINSIDKLWQFVNSGYSGPTGRPIALLTFAWNSNTWPANPYYFLMTNIAIHVACTLLVYLLISCLMIQARFPRDVATRAALINAALWALHPLQVSTVLYIVQRMTLLSAMFSFLTMLGYLIGRQALVERQFSKGSVWLLLGVLTGALAIFSKENALLIPLQLLLIEAFLRWRKTPALPRPVGSIILTGLGVASGMIVFKLASFAEPHIAAFIADGSIRATTREFSFFERLMTECRVVGEYIVSIVIPRIQSPGVFQDGYTVSESLFKPLSTAVWLCFHILLASLAVAVRRIAPILAFGILWFYCGHLVESTVVMLELKFEHRNYLPSLGLLLPVGVWLSDESRFSSLKRILSIALIGLLAIILFLRSSLWGDPESASLVWIEENPRSSRALENAALVHAQMPERYDLVKHILAQAVSVSNDHPVTKLKYFDFICAELDGSKIEWRPLADSLSQAEVDWQLFAVLEHILNGVIEGRCNIVDFDEFRYLTVQSIENPKYSNTRIPLLLYELEARAALVFGETEIARGLYAKQLGRDIPLGMVMRQALWLASYGETEVASGHLAKGIYQEENRTEKDKYLLAQAKDMKSKIEADTGL